MIARAGSNILLLQTVQQDGVTEWLVETEESLTGYNYPVPEIPLELPKPSRPPPGLPTLYGPPPV